ncbi:MAG: AI-2E family transporter [Proteobacteria bacterium]|jgi:AI-2 transport protein TqsA|nr:AI-2E family transporter [Pseudomonadota bacterium]
MPNNTAVFSSGARILITCAAFVVVVAGLRVAAPIVVPFLLAIFIAVIALPPLFWLQQRGVPKLLAMLLVTLVVVLAGLIMAALIGTSLSDFTAEIPAYSERLGNEMNGIMSWLTQHGIHMPTEISRDAFNPSAVMKFVSKLFTGLSSALANTFLILMTVIFILLETSSLPVKLQAVFRDPQNSMQQMRELGLSLNHYVTLKTAVSLLTGISITIWLKIIGVDYPILWGMLAFLLNFIPNIGSIIAAIPAILLALVQAGYHLALLAGLGYLVVNVVVGSIIEPRVLGRGLGLSTLVVFLSLVFWGWILGPVGMLLSVPLTMMVKVALETSQDTRWIAVLLGSEADVQTLTDSDETTAD